MPKGIPANGYRMTKGRRASQKQESFISLVAPNKKESDQEIRARLSERFDILTALTDSAIEGETRALIVSGPAGLGKSFTVEQALDAWDANAINHTIVKGYVKATGLYKTLYNYREAGQVIVFDDADSIFFDDVSLNMLKAVCDTTERRVVSYLAEAHFADAEGEEIPNSFEFNGTIIFITNLDFDSLIDRGHKLTPHLQAMISRAHYIDLAMKTKRDYMVRIQQVLEAGMLRQRGLTAAQEKDVVEFLEHNVDRMRELSLRMAIKLSTIRKSNKPNWKSMAAVTCCRN